MPNLVVGGDYEGSGKKEKHSELWAGRGGDFHFQWYFMLGYIVLEVFCHFTP